MNQRSLKKDIGKYSVLFAIAALACYAFFAITGTTLVKYSTDNADGLTQTYTAYVALRNMVHDLFAGDGISAWTWSLGLGGDTFEYFGFKFFNPFTYFIIAFPENYIDVAYSIANILREYLAGLTFLLCMREVRLGSNQCVVGAITYAFSGWMVEIIYNQGSFENIAIIFPLLIMGIEKIFNRKSPVLFIVSVALTVATGVTWTYIGGILVVVYYLARYHDYHGGETAGDFFRNLGGFVLYGVIGLLIASPFVLSILCSMGGATTDTAAKTNIWTYALDKYLSIPEGLFKYTEVGATSYSYIFISVICVCLLPMLIRSMKRKSTIAWIAVVLSLLSLVPLTSKVFNGFSYAAGRWYFALVFFVVWATVECLTEETLSDRRNLRIMAMWMLLLGVFNAGMFLIGIESFGDVAVATAGVCLGFVFLGLCYLRYVRQNQARWIMPAVALVLVASVAMPSAARTCPLLGDALKAYLKVGVSAEKLDSTPERVVPEIQDNSFFRSDQSYRTNDQMRTKLKTNSNIVYGNNSIYTYSSLVDSEWSQFNKVVGNNSGYYSRTNIFSNDNRAPLDYLLGVKYFLGDNDNEKNASDYAGYGYEEYKTIDGVDVLKNNYCIGLGTAMDRYITESELMEYPELVRDQVMLQAVVIPDDKTDLVKGMKHADRSDITTAIEEVEYELIPKTHIDIDEEGKTISVAGGKGRFRIRCPEVKNAQLVISFQGFSREELDYDEAVRIGSWGVQKPRTAIGRQIKKLSYNDTGDFKIITQYKGTKKYCYCEKNSPRGFNDVENFNINIGYGEKMGGEIRVRLGEPGTYTYDAIKVYAIPMTVLEDRADDLEDSSYRIEKFDSHSGDHLEGSVTADGESILYLSFPYDKGWKAYVDGEETSLMKDVNIGFTGIRLSEGEHRVELVYSHWGMKAALAGTVTGILALAVIIIRRRKNGSIQAEEES